MARMELTEQARLDAARGRARRLRKATSNISSHLLVALVVLIVILPFYVAIVYSFRLEGEIHANGLEWPDHFTLENYRQVIFENQQFATGYVVAYLVYTIGTLVTAPASLNIVAALIGLVVVVAIGVVIAGMIKKTNKNLAAEYALSGK